VRQVNDDIKPVRTLESARRSLVTWW